MMLPTILSPQRQRRKSELLKLTRSDINSDNDEEWRAFRAKLVQNGLPTTFEDTANNNLQSPYQYAHITTPLVEIGSILLSLPTTDICQGLEQQYWHRSVVLITNVTQNTIIGEPIDSSILPEDQLANGNKKGYWSYSGILLNRCTDLLYIDSDSSEETSSEDVWRIHRGGDLLGLDSSDGTDLSCLCMKNKNGDIAVDKKEEVGECGTRLVGNLYSMKLNEAQSLCQQYPSKYTPNDFITFAGFCAWRPGQLELEMGKERQEWIVLSVDEMTIWNELKTQQLQAVGAAIVSPLLLETGTTMWRNMLHRVNISESEATNRLPLGQLEFYDQMLQVWADDNLNINSKNNTAVNEEESILTNYSSYIGPGTLVRAVSPPTNDILLYETEFIQSIIVILEDTSESTVGIILNHVLPAAVEVKENDDALPLRYGGPIDVPSWRFGTYRDDEDDMNNEEIGDDDESEDEEFYDGFLDFQGTNPIIDDDITFDEVYYDDDTNYDEKEACDEDDDSSFIWIHRDAAIGSLLKSNDIRGGTRLGTLNLWHIHEDDALNAIQSGLLSRHDVMVFSGVCIWEKGEGLGVVGGGLREQIDAMHSLEVVGLEEEDDDDNDGNANNDIVESIWDILVGQQQVLTKDTLENNTDASSAAWSVCRSKKKKIPSHPSSSQTYASQRIDLASAALKAWVGRSLLNDPLGTVVEIEKRTDAK